MKKIIILMAMLIVVATTAFAANMELNTVKVTVNDETVSGVNEDGGTIKVLQEDTINFYVKVANNMNNVSDARFQIILYDIDDGDDKTIERPLFSIGAGETTEKYKSYTIPDDADEGSYDAIMKIWFKPYNQSEYEYDSIDFTIKVSKLDVASINQFSNLTQTCSDVISMMAPLYSYVNSSLACSDELSTVKEERGIALSDKADCSEKLTTAVEERNTCVQVTVPDLNQQINTLTNEKAVMINLEQCNTITADKVKDATDKAKSENLNLMLMIGAGGFGLWWWNNNKNKKSTVEEKVYMRKM